MSQFKKRTWLYYGVAALGSVVYGFLTLTAPRSASTQQNFELSAMQILLLQITIMIPYVISWFSGVSGVLALEKCAQVLGDNGHKKGFHYLSLGVAIVALGYLFASLISGFKPYFPPDWGIAQTILNNYIYVLLAFFSSLCFFVGSRHLVAVRQDSTAEKDDIVMSVIITFLLAALYVPLVFTNDHRQVAASITSMATYYLADPLIVLTIILPLIASWILGLLAIFRLNRFLLPITADTQRHGTRMFTNGLGIVLFASIFLQILVSIGTDRLLGSGVVLVLVLVFLFIGLQVVGFLSIFFGARTMSKAVEKHYNDTAVIAKRPKKSVASQF
ncbi:MAG: hypothetical protein AAB870_03960 [Patescibacteria group bacterium]